MHVRSALMSMVALAVVGIGASTGTLSAAAELPARMFAPAYDATTVSSLHDLALALASYDLDAGGYDGLTVAALADWGWTPGSRTAVTIWVSGADVHIVGQDVGAGSTQFEYTTAPGAASSGAVVPSVTQPAAPPHDAIVTLVVAARR